MKGFNNLEIQIFNWFKNKYDNSEFITQINNAEVVEREWTKVGFFVNLKVPSELAPIIIVGVYEQWPITGPYIKSDGIDNGGGSLLFGENGYITMLELFSYGDYFKQNIQNFTLHSK